MGAAPSFALESEQVIRRSPDEVFAFFSDPANLEALTPPWLRFRIVGCSTPRIEAGVVVGDRVDYDVRCAALVHGRLVRPDLERIFAYRRERLAALFPDARSD